MATTLLTTGLLCIIAAIVGGGVKALGGEVPVITSRKRQIALGVFGLVLLVIGAYVQVPSGSSLFLPKLEGTTWVGTNGTNDEIVFGADTAVVIQHLPTGGDRLPRITKQDCSWTAFVGTITLKCVSARVVVVGVGEVDQYDINSVYKLRVNGISMRGTMHYAKNPLTGPERNANVILVKKLN